MASHIYGSATTFSSNGPKFGANSTIPIWGRGIDGNVTAAAGTLNVSSSVLGSGATITSAGHSTTIPTPDHTVDAAWRVVTLVSGLTYTVAAFTNHFRAGDQALLYQARNTGGGTAGAWEVVQIASVNDNTSITLTAAPTKTFYYPSGQLFIIRIPEYHTMTLSGTATITADAWDTGGPGVLAIKAKYLSLAGSAVFTMNAKGFRGGKTPTNSSVLGEGRSGLGSAAGGGDGQTQSGSGGSPGQDMSAGVIQHYGGQRAAPSELYFMGAGGAGGGGGAAGVGGGGGGGNVIAGSSTTAGVGGGGGGGSGGGGAYQGASASGGTNGNAGTPGGAGGAGIANSPLGFTLTSNVPAVKAGGGAGGAGAPNAPSSTGGIANPEPFNPLNTIALGGGGGGGETNVTAATGGNGALASVRVPVTLTANGGSSGAGWVFVGKNSIKLLSEVNIYSGINLTLTVTSGTFTSGSYVFNTTTGFDLKDAAQFFDAGAAGTGTGYITISSPGHGGGGGGGSASGAGGAGVTSIDGNGDGTDAPSSVAGSSAAGTSVFVGGNGGGVILVWCDELIGANFTANGSSGTTGITGAAGGAGSSETEAADGFRMLGGAGGGGGGGGGSGGGGGGAGGGVVVQAQSYTATAWTVSAGSGGAAGSGGPGGSGGTQAGGASPHGGTGGAGGSGFAGSGGGIGGSGGIGIRYHRTGSTFAGSSADGATSPTEYKETL